MNVFLKHLCALCRVAAYVQMFYTCMHLYFELHACTFLLKMKKSQTILCWFNCYYFREMALEIPRIPHKKYGKNNAKICRDEYERVFWIHTCFKYHSCVCHTWVFTKGDNVSQLVSERFAICKSATCMNLKFYPSSIKSADFNYRK